MQPPTPRRLLVFARNPVAGRVKTRLIPAVGAEAATALYWRILERTLATASGVSAQSRELWLDSGDPDPRLARLAHAHGLSLHAQAGAGLGQRMHAAFAQAMRDAGCAVLIGTDCPEFRVQYIDAAFAALSTHDAVIGPAADGGYVLLGLRRPQAPLFAGVPWGSAQVLAATRQRLQRQQLTWQELPVLHDLDEPADLVRFPDLLAGLPGQPWVRAQH
ncbi:MAG: TIGR04282 family arsenosugar biosynthesis glycosyltransferase [Chromatiaceae bacterium]|jgi:hypothetical protein|nr:TIGR04282 family arsenosugar biosynthesis glycosyltransferase [Chromatiaceae bacterium]